MLGLHLAPYDKGTKHAGPKLGNPKKMVGTYLNSRKVGIFLSYSFSILGVPYFGVPTHSLCMKPLDVALT